MIHLLKYTKMCLRCGKDNSEEEWQSQTVDNFHYKIIKCNCGKQKRIKVDFYGDGFDNWDNNLEKKLRDARR